MIANATDAYPPEGRAEAVNRELAALSELGFAAEELDLRDHFDDPHVASKLRRYDLIWARGGDVFTLRYSLAKSGADDALGELLASDVIAYGGYSAGICVLAPTLRGLEEVDDPTWLRSLYDADPHWEGLGILDYCLVPHIDSTEATELLTGLSATVRCSSSTAMTRKPAPDTRWSTARYRTCGAAPDDQAISPSA